MNTGKCFKCKGSGKYNGWGKCFRCGGKGFVWLHAVLSKDKWIYPKNEIKKDTPPLLGTFNKN